MDLNKKEILNKVKKITEDLGYLFIELEFRGDSRNHILELYIDNELGITTVDCSKVSKAVADLVESDNLIESRYRLNVSSPGIDRPLKYISQFHKNIKRSFEVIIEETNEKFNGDLISVNDNDLEFKIGKKIKIINIEKIKSAKVVIRF